MKPAAAASESAHPVETVLAQTNSLLRRSWERHAELKRALADAREEFRREAKGQ